MTCNNATVRPADNGRNNATPLRQLLSLMAARSFILLLIAQHAPTNAQASDETSPMDPRRPIWNIAHMVNSIRELDYRLSKGANAIEADVTFSASGTPLMTFHGTPCDCMRHCNQRDTFADYLRHTRELIDPVNGRLNGRNLTLLFLDLKLEPLSHQAKVNAGIQLAKMISAHLYTNITQPIYTILSVNHATDVDLVLNFVHYINQNNSDNLMRHIGWDVGMNDDIKLIESMWKKFRTTLNLWQGDGFTNCISPFYNLNRLSRALAIRNSGGYMSKVYQWTIDLHDRMRDALRLHVDGIMTNHPERLVTILEEPEFSGRFRLATKQDDPFQRISSTSYMRRFGDAARFNQQATPETGPVVSGGFSGAVMDILNSWATYTREITLLKVPEIATRLIPKRRRAQKEYPFAYDNYDMIIASDTDTTTTVASTVPETVFYPDQKVVMAQEFLPDHSIDSTKSPVTSSPNKVDSLFGGANGYIVTIFKLADSLLRPILNHVFNLSI